MLLIVVACLYLWSHKHRLLVSHVACSLLLILSLLLSYSLLIYLKLLKQLVSKLKGLLHRILNELLVFLYTMRGLVS